MYTIHLRRMDSVSVAQVPVQVGCYVGSMWVWEYLCVPRVFVENGSLRGGRLGGWIAQLDGRMDVWWFESDGWVLAALIVYNLVGFLPSHRSSVNVIAVERHESSSFRVNQICMHFILYLIKRKGQKSGVWRNGMMNICRSWFEEAIPYPVTSKLLIDFECIL